MNILAAGVDDMRCAEPSGKGQFLIVDVGSDDGGATQRGTHNGPHAHHAAADDHHHIGVRDRCAADGVEAHAHRLHEGTRAGIKPLGDDNLLPGQRDVGTHGTVALHAQRLVVLAGIHPSAAARGTLPAVGVGIDGDHHARAQRVGHTVAHLLHHGTNLVPRDDRHTHHRVAPQPRVEV